MFDLVVWICLSYTFIYKCNDEVANYLFNDFY